MSDPINHPTHYTSHPSGVECIVITEHMNFCIGNAIKYLWRAGLKTSSPLEDLKKAEWYVRREIARLEKPREPKVHDGRGSTRFDCHVCNSKAGEFCTNGPPNFDTLK